MPANNAILVYWFKDYLQCILSARIYFYSSLIRTFILYVYNSYVVYCVLLIDILYFVNYDIIQCYRMCLIYK